MKGKISEKTYLEMSKEQPSWKILEIILEENRRIVESLLAKFRKTSNQNLKETYLNVLREFQRKTTVRKCWKTY